MNSRSPRPARDISSTGKPSPTSRGPLSITVRVLLAMAALATILRPGPAHAQTTPQPPQAPDDSTVEVVKNVPFGGTASDPLLLNVYKPTTKDIGRPAIVLIHGGSWTQGGPDGMDTQGKLLAQQGWVGFSVSYRLAVPGQPSWPANAEDVRSAVRWVGAHAREYGADPTRIALLGESAGGHLAALVGATGFSADPNGATDSKATRIRAVATFSAPLDLEQLVPVQGEAPPSCGDDESCKVFWKLPLVPGMLGCQPEQCPDTYQKASPVRQVTKSTPPMFLANARDEIVPPSQLQLMSDALTKQGVAVHTQLLDGKKHGNEYTSKVWNEMMPFLADELGVPTPQPIAFTEDREFKDYLLFIFIGLFAVGLLLLFMVAAIRGKWDEPGA